MVPSISDPQTASVLASTRNASLAAAKLVGAGTAGSPLTLQDFEEIAVIDASVLDTPLDANEQADGRDTIAAQYRQNPTAFVKSLEIEHKLAGVLLHGSPAEQLQARTIAWLGWLGAAQTSPLAALVGCYRQAPQLAHRLNKRSRGHKPSTRRYVCFE